MMPDAGLGLLLDLANALEWFESEIALTPSLSHPMGETTPDFVNALHPRTR
jgi:hypothetical protein